MKTKFTGSRLYKYLRPFTSWRFVISFGFAWLLTNGWAYYFGFTPLNIPIWLRAFALSYLTFIYLPVSPEKLVTIPIAIWIHIKLFKNDKVTHNQLEEMHIQAKQDWLKIKNKLFKRKKRPN